MKYSFERDSVSISNPSDTQDSDILEIVDDRPKVKLTSSDVNKNFRLYEEYELIGENR